MKECHLLLRRPWLSDRRPIYDGFKYIYSFKIKGKKIILAPLNPVLDPKPSKRKGEILIANGECPQELKDEFALMGENKVDNESISIVKSVLEEFHHMDSGVI